MYYWNQDNFTGLKHIYDHFKNDAYFALYAEYCHFRESGLRKVAFQKLKQFIQHCESLDMKVQQHIVITLIELIYNHSAIHQLISDPLKHYLIKVFSEWQATEPHDVLTYQWLGYLCYEIEYYQKALELDPNNQFCLIKLAQFHLDKIDWQTHHLHESFLIGELEHAYEHLGLAQSLLEKIKPSDQKQKLEIDYRYYDTLLHTWENYKNNNAKISFSDWCDQYQIDFHEYMTFYYSK
ncbi:hypothetical protein [Acinetobacter shaoyimingii]|uniref:Tetratricopeptide repeat protein n=1 Tax=Acinetobacter shaoyimingii TaxID=2715164 RepID=A0A6G8RYX3_9GAMM|nr:hypothetical protein [Acinetobacter shaoyimingii]QIO07071.1 hypothetical protein G8E00_14565 [Acinetobacter shaoyimingii]